MWNMDFSIDLMLNIVNPIIFHIKAGILSSALTIIQRIHEQLSSVERNMMRRILWIQLNIGAAYAGTLRLTN